MDIVKHYSQFFLALQKDLSIDVNEWNILGNPLSMSITIFNTSSNHIKYISKGIQYLIELKTLKITFKSIHKWLKIINF